MVKDFSHNDSCADVMAWIIKFGSSDQKAVGEFMLLGDANLFQRGWGRIYKVIADYFREGRRIAVDDELEQRLTDIVDEADDNDDGVLVDFLYDRLEQSHSLTAWKPYVARLMESYKRGLLYDVFCKFMETCMETCSEPWLYGVAKAEPQNVEHLYNIIMKMSKKIDRMPKIDGLLPVAKE